MWMMGYNDGGELNFQDSFNGRKLRPLIPRPLSSVTTTSSTLPPLNHIHGNDFLALHHMAAVTDQSKRELNAPPVVVSSRWNPTTEQLRVLEELYRRGTRTPSAEQIQHITAQLRRYGKIEGKNVFYWFQNHKARERQKRRRQMELAVADISGRDVEILQSKDSAYGVEQNKNWALSTNCSTLAEECVPIQRTAKAAAAQMAESRTDGWMPFDDHVGELHQRRNNIFTEKNNASLLPHCTAALANGQLMMMNSASTMITATVTTIMHPKSHNSFNIGGNGENDVEEEGESETLQLFPLCSDIRNDDNGGKQQSEIIMENSAINSHLTPLQYFEFLPLKN